MKFAMINTSPLSPTSDHEDSFSGTNSTSTSSPLTKLYKKRYFILFVFFIYSMSNSFQWIEYSIIQNIIVEYYQVSVFWVNATSVVYMISYIFGIIPATWLLDKKGLRYCLILGSFGNCLGSWLKCFSIPRNRFWITFIGQSIVATSQLFVLNIPPLLAAIWFSETEISRATAIGVLGNQLGIAFGFYIPPLLVSNMGNNTVEDVNNVSTGLTYLFYGVSTVTSAIFLMILLFFTDKPKYPPSTAQAHAQVAKLTSSFEESLKSLMKNRGFIILFITYGLNAGVFYAVSTVLNQMVTEVFGDESTEDAGYMGVIIIFAGMVGSVICGVILDATHRYKEITVLLYICSFAGMIAFASALILQGKWFLFPVSALLGFFMTGYLPIGFEFGAEISYPEPESTSAGLLNTSAQLFGIIFTFGGSFAIETWNQFVANCFYLIALASGTVLTFMIKPDLRRQNTALRMNAANKLLNQL